jgi:hypothetical protein
VALVSVDSANANALTAKRKTAATLHERFINRPSPAHNHKGCAGREPHEPYKP